MIGFELDKLSNGLLNNQRRHDFDLKFAKIQDNKETKLKRIQEYKIDLNIFRGFTGLVKSFAVLFVSHRSSSPVGITTWRETCKE